MKNEEKSQIYFVVFENVCDYFKIFGSGAEK
jgi:hypothetical protein